MKKILSVILPLGFCILLFTHPVLAAEGCTAGLTLWYQAVLPSLLPFTDRIRPTDPYRHLSLPEQLLCTFVSTTVPDLRGGLLCCPDGFSVWISNGCQGQPLIWFDERHLPREEGTYLLGFCNNVKSGFFYQLHLSASAGMSSRLPWALCVLLFYAHAASATGYCTRPFYHFSDDRNICTKKQAPHAAGMQFPMLDACMMDSFATVAKLGGYIVLFSILVRMMQLLPLPTPVAALISSLLEISCGIHQITALTGCSTRLMTACACACASFGGFSIWAQTSSVLHDTTLTIRSWLTGRIILALLTPVLLLTLPPLS